MEFSENYVSIIVDGEDWRHSEQLRPEEIEELKRCRIIIQLKWGLQHLYPRLRLADGGQYRGVHGGLRREGVGVALNPKNGKLLHNKLERSGVDNIYAIGDVLGGKWKIYRVLQNNWQTLAAYNWDIIWSFLSVFGLFWLSNMGDFSLWYSLGIGMKKKLKNFTLKKG